MSLSRSPSPRPNGGWPSPGLTNSNERPSSRRAPYEEVNGNADAPWAAAKLKSEQIRGYPSFQTRNEGFFQRSRRKISATLPRFNSFGPNKKDWRDTEKLGRGRWYPRGEGTLSSTKTFVGNVLRKFKFLFILLAIILGITLMMSKTSRSSILC